MNVNEFVQKFAGEFEETPIDQFAPNTIYKDLEEWGSLLALSIIAIVDEEFEKKVTGADLRQCNTIEDLYNLIISK